MAPWTIARMEEGRRVFKMLTGKPVEKRAFIFQSAGRVAGMEEVSGGFKILRGNYFPVSKA